MIPKTIPKICVVPIFLVTDHVIPTGKKWNIASPGNHRKWLTPFQNVDIWVIVCVPFFKVKFPAASNILTASKIFLKPKINPPTIIAGMIGAKISANVDIILCSGVWFDLASTLAWSFETPSTPDTSEKSL